MPPALRDALAAIAGVLLAGLVVGLVESLGHAIWPPPPGVDLSDPAALAGLMDQVPLPAKVAVLVAWAAGAFAGAAAATRLAVARPARAGGLVGAVQLGLGLATLFMIPHPAWMIAGAVLGVPLAAFAGVRAARRP